MDDLATKQGKLQVGDLIVCVGFDGKLEDTAYMDKELLTQACTHARARTRARAHTNGHRHCGMRRTARYSLGGPRPTSGWIPNWCHPTLFRSILYKPCREADIHAGEKPPNGIVAARLRPKCP